MFCCAVFCQLTHANDKYMGAANMSGHLRGVASRFKEEEPADVYVHCFAHSLNLCLQDAFQSCTSVHDSLELVMEIVKIIKKILPNVPHSSKQLSLSFPLKLIISSLLPNKVTHNLKPPAQQGGQYVLVPSKPFLTIMKHYYRLWMKFIQLVVMSMR